tara:strand:- start:5156 stop:5527 length:372 start_codon:yes stop_codon:yes gene_type:complete
MSDLLWNCEQLVTDFDIDVPQWVEQDIAVYDVASILQGGCASGAYMPAVTYVTAQRIMAEHGDDVVEYLDQACHGEYVLDVEKDTFCSFCVKVLSAAVDQWAVSVSDQLESAVEESQEDAADE